MDPDHVTVLSDSGPASLVALLAALDTGARVCAAPWGDAARAGHPAFGALQRQSGELGFDLAPAASDAPGRPLAEALALLGAVSAAIERAKSAPRPENAVGGLLVIWPVHLGGGDAGASLDRIGAALDRALLVSRLASMDADVPGGVRLEAPYADLTDRQVAELALDLDAPLHTCWWADVDAGPDAAAERDRWERVLRSASWQAAKGAGAS